jgi:hypothetical protein
MNTLHNELADRMLRLQRTWRVMTGLEDDATDADALAARWASALSHSVDHIAEAAANDVRQYLVSDAETTTSTFWATDLGRALARHGHAPVNAAGQVPAATVGAILGFTRSRASELQGRGRLCTPTQVASALREREGATT